MIQCMGVISTYMRITISHRNPLPLGSALGRARPVPLVPRFPTAAPRAEDPCRDTEVGVLVDVRFAEVVAGFPM